MPAGKYICMKSNGCADKMLSPRETSPDRSGPAVSGKMGKTVVVFAAVVDLLPCPSENA